MSLSLHAVTESSGLAFRFKRQTTLPNVTYKRKQTRENVRA